VAGLQQAILNLPFMVVKNGVILPQLTHHFTQAEALLGHIIVIAQAIIILVIPLQ